MIYIANDVESAGSKLGVHSTLSWGACVVIREHVSFEEYWKRGLVFYAELKPESLDYRDIEAMRIGCSQLICLEQVRKPGNVYDVASRNFDTYLVLKLMQEHCEYPGAAARRFHNWIKIIRTDPKEKIVGITDTVFFDGGRVDLLLNRCQMEPSPYGHKGIDLYSTYCGYVSRYSPKVDIKLKELGVPDQRTKPHRADQDAVYLAQIARELLFKRMGW